MKLTLKGHDYRYAAEQMMLTLFPGERPGAGENALTLSLFPGGVLAYRPGRADLGGCFLLRRPAGKGR